MMALCPARFDGGQGKLSCQPNAWIPLHRPAKTGICERPFAAGHRKMSCQP